MGGAAADGAGARLLLDTTQAVGWLPLRADAADVTVTSLYKWVPAPRGACLTTFSDRALAELRPLAPGARAAAAGTDPFFGWPSRLREDARRFDVSPVWAAWAGAVPALRTALDLGVRAVHDHDLRPVVAAPPDHAAGRLDLRRFGIDRHGRSS